MESMGTDCLLPTSNYDPSKITDMRHEVEDTANRLWNFMWDELTAQEGQIRILERQNRELRSKVARLESANGELQG